MAAPSSTHVLVAVPADTSALARFTNALAAARGGKGYKGPPATLCGFPAPSLRVGTLDALMAMSDELARADGLCEGIAHKAERACADHAGAGGLKVGGRPVEEYTRQFTWDAKYDAKVCLV